MNLEDENVIALAWKEPSASKSAVLQVLYVGADIELGRDILNAALNNGSISFGRLIRGAFPSGNCQLMHAVSTLHPPSKPTAVLPATGR